MPSLIVVSLFIVAAVRAVDLKAPVVDLDMIAKINAIKPGWVAGVNDRFVGMTAGEVKRLCGARRGGPELPLLPETPQVVLPEHFDAREKWPQCRSLFQIRDQGKNCGSCWAVSSTEVFTDRHCIDTNGTYQPILAAADTLSCCPECGSCNGGYPPAAFQYWQHTGVVTGGPYNSSEGCYPFEIPPRNWTVSHKLQEPTPVCKHECINELNWDTDKNFAIDIYRVASKAQAIQAALLQGPLSASMMIYLDFTSYKGGVYRHVTGPYLGLHAVKIIGWGNDEETGAPYWLIANSWGKYWAENGFFRILRGKNECDVESLVYGGNALTTMKKGK